MSFYVAISIPSLVKMTRSPRSFIGGKEESFLLVGKVLDLSATKTILQRYTLKSQTIRAGPEGAGASARRPPENQANYKTPKWLPEKTLSHFHLQNTCDTLSIAGAVYVRAEVLRPDFSTVLSLKTIPANSLYKHPSLSC